MASSGVNDLSPVIVYLSRTTSSEPLLVIQGEIDGDPHQVIEHSIIDAAQGSTTVHLDLTRVAFMGSTGIRILIQASRELEADGKRLVVDVASHVVRRVLEVTALDEYFGLPPGRHDGRPPR